MVSRNGVADGWNPISEARYAHASGARLELRVSPSRPGWYLVSADPSQPDRRFPPTPQGRDEALAAWSGRYATVEALTRVLTS